MNATLALVGVLVVGLIVWLLWRHQRARNALMQRDGILKELREIVIVLLIPSRQMMKTNWHHDAAQERGESIPSLHPTCGFASLRPRVKSNVGPHKPREQ